MPIKKNLKIALIQNLPPDSKNQEDFIATGVEYCTLAAKKGADIVLFPELWSVGYSFPSTNSKAADQAWGQRAVRKDSKFVTSFQELARQLDIAIVITYLEDSQSGGKPRNSATLFDRNGDEQLHYSKVHTCNFTDEILTGAGDEFRVGKLSTNVGDVNIGLMICFDREIPESARILMLRGAEIILVPNASHIQNAQLEQLSTRAFENMVGVAMANYPVPKCNGKSAAFSPLIEDKNQNPVDNCLILTDGVAGIYYCEFDISAIRNWRNKMIWGRTYRRPGAYKDLTIC